MIFVLIGMIAGTIIGFKSMTGWGRIWAAALGWLLGLIVGTFLSMLFGAIGHKISPDSTETRLTHTTNIVVLSDNATVSGTFALGSGSVNGEMYYSYYEDLGDDRFRLDKIRNSHNVTIEIIRDSRRARIEYYDLVWVNWIGMWIGKKTIIFIPKNTIKNGFLLDAK